MSWWAHRYNKPMKDPILLSYTIEELSYEYFDHIERKRAEDERIQKDTDKIESEKAQAAEAWADEMERLEELEEVETSQSQPLPGEDPSSIEWMNKILEESKEEFGESFGEDLSIDFGR